MDEPTCNAPRARSEIHVSSLNLDKNEFSFLYAARYFFATFADNDHTAWMTAILQSPEFFEGSDSAEKMRLALGLVHEMRATRQSVFRFSNPRCRGCMSRVTQDERHLLQLLQHVRAGRRSQAASSAMLLCQGFDTTRVLSAARVFAHAIRMSNPQTLTA